ncbi:hypothetical protein [Methylomarinum vadi]|uniref:hypothetical protein n=1 Tax=Methylomarinum vadi TaxID=438855 RepID=UPI0004DF26CA|nr:hypothetical protein [Methylomarinum vadi]
MSLSLTEEEIGFPSYVSRILRLTLSVPVIQEVVINSTRPPTMTPAAFMDPSPEHGDFSESSLGSASFNPLEKEIPESVTSIIGWELNNHPLKRVGSNNGLKVRIRVD